MKRAKELTKKIILDLIGVSLLIGSLVLSPVPGPGGIPLLIAGLSVLAINHEWARNLLHRVRTEGDTLLTRLFVEHPYTGIVVICTVVVLCVFGIYGITQASSLKFKALSASLILIASSLLILFHIYRRKSRVK